MLWIPKKAYVDPHAVITFANELKPVYNFFSSQKIFNSLRINKDRGMKNGTGLEDENF